MNAYILKRCSQLIVVLIVASLLIFSMIHLAPGDPLVVLLGERATADQMQRMRQAFGLDQPLHVQYLKFMWNCLQGNFGGPRTGRAPCLMPCFRVCRSAGSWR